VEPGNWRWALLQLALAVLSVALFCAAILITFASDFFDPAPGSLLLVAGLIAATFAVRMSPTGRLVEGLKIGVAWLLFGCVALGVTRGFVQRGHGSTACLSQVKQQATAMLMYAADFDDHFPLAESWHSACYPYVKVEFRCPLATSAWSYAMDSSMSSVLTGSVDEPERQVLLFEGNAALPNASGGREWLVFRHGTSDPKAATLGFVDSHAKYLPPTKAAALKW
jgi:phosphate/sulfate permease